MIPMRFERLERRDVPAGTVTATLRGSTWTLVGDELANSITVQATGDGAFTLVGSSGTSVTGDTAIDGVRNVVVWLGPDR